MSGPLNRELVEFLDPPTRITAAAIAARYNITERNARDWLARMGAAGVAVRIGRFAFARWSAADAWVMSGAPLALLKRRGGPR